MESFNFHGTPNYRPFHGREGSNFPQENRTSSLTLTYTIMSARLVAFADLKNHKHIYTTYNQCISYTRFEDAIFGKKRVKFTSVIGTHVSNKNDDFLLSKGFPFVGSEMKRVV